MEYQKDLMKQHSEDDISSVLNDIRKHSKTAPTIKTDSRNEPTW